ncbi:MAG: FAD-binding oxidoreductase [Verrucomicrobiota bacterium]
MNFVDSLRELLGDEKVSTDASVLKAHSSDAWLVSEMPEVVVFAQSSEDVCAVMRLASEKHIPVTTRGSGRGYVGGCVPLKGGIVLSLATMNRIKEISTEDGVIIVEPGVITARVRDEAQKYGLFYPPDPASLDSSSIGGNIATNAGGPRCLKYGVTRNYVLGLAVVLPNGDLVRMGGRTLKNKTGFDVLGLFVGSEGMLGVITEATLRLIPHPPARAAMVATFPTAREAARMVSAIQRAGILPSALEIADAFTLKSARNYVPHVPAGDAFILLEVDGQAACVHHEVELLEKLFKECGALNILRAEDEEACKKLWKMRRMFSDSLKATGLKKFNEDVVVPCGKLLDLFDWAEKTQKTTGAAIACFGHAGDGNIHVNIMVAPDSEIEAYRPLLDSLFGQVLNWGGAITGEHGIGIAKKRWWPKAASVELRTLHQHFKKTIDPLNILNPGKFLDADG